MFLYISFPWKLVRDNVPLDIERLGGYCIVKQLSGAAYRKALAAKLVEEAMECAKARTRAECATELADLYSAAEAYRVACGLPEQEVDMARRVKDAKMGQFSKGFKLMFVFKSFLTRRKAK